VEDEVRYFSLPDTVVVEQEKAPIVESIKEVEGFREDIKTEYLKRQDDLHAIWAVANATEKKNIKFCLTNRREYHKAEVISNPVANILEVQKLIREFGLESICSVQEVQPSITTAYFNELLFTCK
jgi:hypothetical protein